jgi:hypothetical protein
VHTKCQIIYTHWTYYVDAVYQQVYRMAEKLWLAVRALLVRRHRMLPVKVSEDKSYNTCI